MNLSNAVDIAAKNLASLFNSSFQKALTTGRPAVVATADALKTIHNSKLYKSIQLDPRNKIQAIEQMIELVQETTGERPNLVKLETFRDEQRIALEITQETARSSKANERY